MTLRQEGAQKVCPHFIIRFENKYCQSCHDGAVPEQRINETHLVTAYAPISKHIKFVSSFNSASCRNLGLTYPSERFLCITFGRRDLLGTFLECKVIRTMLCIPFRILRPKNHRIDTVNTVITLVVSARLKANQNMSSELK